MQQFVCKCVLEEGTVLCEDRIQSNDDIPRGGAQPLPPIQLMVIALETRQPQARLTTWKPL